MLLTLRKIVGLTVALSLCHLCVAMPGRFIRAADNDLIAVQLEDVEGDLNPVNAADISSRSLERNKRKLPDAAFEAKNAVLGFVFGIQPTHKRVRRQGRPDAADASQFDRSDVSLDVSGDLINQSFKALTNVSRIVSGFIMNSARRYSRFVLFLKPIFGDALMVRGFEDPTTTTTTTTTTPRTTTTAPSTVDVRFNEV